MNKSTLSESVICDRFIHPEVGGLAARVEKERAWVDIAAIQAAGFNMDQKSPHSAEAVSHGPDEVQRDHVRLQIEAQLLRDPLKAILGESLGVRR
jgi:type I restriction enzyme M protein